MNFKGTLAFISCFSLLIAVLLSCILFNGCRDKVEQRYVLTGDTIANGKNLVKINCTKCHALVPVNALSKAVWKFHTLPAMAHYLGLTPYLDGYFKKDTSGLTLLEWQNIVAYYQKTAPDSLSPAKPPVKVINNTSLFTVKAPAESDSVVYTTMVSVNPYNHKIYTADGVANILQEWDNNLKKVRSMPVPSPAVNASYVKGKNGDVSMVLSCIGQLEPIDFPNGKVISIGLNSELAKSEVFQSELLRPVQTISADFNKDGLDDQVVLAQGYLKGGVYMFKQTAGGKYSQDTISRQSGATKAIAGDFNKDGWLDLIVLFGRGDEGLVLFLNDQHGGFTQKKLLSFPPVYGSTNFEIADIDHDGNPDLIYSCGYNYNDSRILKPYHGLYVFKNIGGWRFKQQWFYPINGCTKFVMADFKGGGKLGIVTTAFFADLKNNPAEGCIYFEQDKPFSFKPYTIPVSRYGRWMSMDLADINNDGKPDIVLGNYSTGFNFQNGVKQSWSKHLPFIVLQNIIKK